MPNQDKSNRADRTGGGDVTKSEQVATPETDHVVREDYAGTHGTYPDPYND